MMKIVHLYSFKFYCFLSLLSFNVLEYLGVLRLCCFSIVVLFFFLSSIYSCFQYLINLFSTFFYDICARVFIDSRRRFKSAPQDKRKRIAILHLTSFFYASYLSSKTTNKVSMILDKAHQSPNQVCLTHNHVFHV